MELSRRASNRFIPAHAGNSRKPYRATVTTPVHPRACGELVGELPVAPSLNRFIPAHAGNSSVGRGGSGDPTVHPRACGELICDPSPFDGPIGSSPRMRGTLATPTCLRRRSSVHPRACGELRVESIVRRKERGSSPRMRGTRVPHHHGLAPDRFIPAHAGNSRASPPEITESSVHPRACGELGVLPDGESAVIGSSPRMRGTRPSPSFTRRPLHGSSPRMRGTREYRRISGRWVRFIPAHAGNSAVSLKRSTAHAVHPRACGELPSAPSPA